MIQVNRANVLAYRGGSARTHSALNSTSSYTLAIDGKLAANEKASKAINLRRRWSIVESK
jgi:hypothetical protein